MSESSLDELLGMEVEVGDHLVARAYVGRVVGVVMPNRAEEPWWSADYAAAVGEHCRQRGYQVSDGGRNRFGYRTWQIDVHNGEEPASLSLNGEVFLLDFPGGFTWPEFGYTPAEGGGVLQDQLALLDAYADPATLVVSVRRALRGSRTELHLADGTRLWRGGGVRARSE